MWIITVRCQKTLTPRFLSDVEMGVPVVKERKGVLINRLFRDCETNAVL